MTGRVSSAGWRIVYLGWSGFHIYRSGAAERGPHLFIDPPKGTPFPDRAEIILFLTHGHPEHLGGALDHIRHSPARPRTTIIASETVCRYLAGRNRLDLAEFIPVQPGQHKTVTPDFAFEVFKWRHMPLLPPGMGPAIRHVACLLRGFRAAARIVGMALRGPLGPGAMLGYVLRLPGGPDVIVYGEGLHRRCRAGEVAAVGDRAPGAMLLVAAEPEDINQLPALVVASGAAEAILYEPHRPWRDKFGLPHIDLPTLRETIAAAGVPARIAELGTRIGE